MGTSYCYRTTVAYNSAVSQFCANTQLQYNNVTCLEIITHIPTNLNPALLNKLELCSYQQQLTLHIKRTLLQHSAHHGCVLRSHTSIKVQLSMRFGVLLALFVAKPFITYGKFWLSITMHFIEK